MSKSTIIKIIIAIFIIISMLFIILNKEPKINEKKPIQIPNTFKINQKYITKQTPEKIEIKSEIPSVITDKTIYLTFDDGPSYLTDKILDILEAEQIPATFFVIGTNIEKYQNTIKRAYQSGHAIALHTNTHIYQEVYASDDNYFNDLHTINNKVYKITGHRSRIVRLPGGSSNTVSKKYNEGIISRITNKLTDNSYYYYDWNVDSEDASGKLDPTKIANNVITHLNYRENIVLMHDSATKNTTVDALNQIIKYGKENGYSFAKITKNTVQIHHHINN